jgi:predicted dehydrogenase
LTEPPNHEEFDSKVNRGSSEELPTLQVALVGLGKLGLLHAGIVNALSGSKLVAVVDQDRSVLEILKSQSKNIQTFRNHQDLLKIGGIDAAIIATPTHTHPAIAGDFVEAGIPVFIEKPLGALLGETRKLVATLKKKSVPNMVGYMGRFIPAFVKARDLCSKGVLGDLQFLRSSMYVSQLFRRGKGWRYDKEKSGGGVLITQNAHVIDSLLWLFGPIEAVSGHIRSIYSKSVEDYVHAYLLFENGMTGFMDASWSVRHYRQPTISIHAQGSNGTIDVSDDGVRLYLEKSTLELPKGWSSWQKPDLYAGVEFNIGGHEYSRQMEAFLTSVREQTEVISNIETAYRTQCVVEAIYQSARAEGRMIRLAELYDE